MKRIVLAMLLLLALASVSALPMAYVTGTGWNDLNPDQKLAFVMGYCFSAFPDSLKRYEDNPMEYIDDILLLVDRYYRDVEANGADKVYIVMASACGLVLKANGY